MWERRAGLPGDGDSRAFQEDIPAALGAGALGTSPLPCGHMGGPQRGFKACQEASAVIGPECQCCGPVEI